MAADPAEFRRRLLIDRGDGQLVPFSEAMTPWQRERAAALDPGWQRCIGLEAVGGYSRAYAETVRGEGKTTLLGAECLWPLFASRRRIVGAVLAADQDQARLVADAVQRHLDCNPWLGAFIKVQRNVVVNVQTGSEVRIMASDAPTSSGWLLHFLLIDEFTCIVNELLWSLAASAIAKMPNAVLSIASNAGRGQYVHWTWRVREACFNSPDWFISKVDHPTRTSAKHLAEQKLLLPPSEYARLWENRWASGSGDALAESDIAAAFSHNAEAVEAPEVGWVYGCGLDLATRRDFAALAVVGRELNTSLLRLCKLWVWRPPAGGEIDLQAVQAQVLSAARMFRAPVFFDEFQAALMAQQLREKRITMQPVPFAGGSLHRMASTLIEAFQARNIVLPRCDQLKADLQRVSIVSRPFGYKLEIDRGAAGQGHGDTVVALVLGALAAGEAERPRRLMLDCITLPPRPYDFAGRSSTGLDHERAWLTG